MRRFVTDTLYNNRSELMQLVVIYPAEINHKQVKKELGRLTVKKSILVKENNEWRYEELTS